MGKKILLIDDEDLVIKSVLKLLTKEGYEVFACHSGREGVEISQKEAVDLIICDIRMPQQDGVETLKQIREARRKKRLKSVPELLMTGYADEVANRNAEDLKVAEYIYKPFDLRDFLNAVKKHTQD